MPTDRNTILANVRDALAQLPRRAAYPTYEDSVAISQPAVEDPWDRFTLRLRAVNGQPMTSVSELKTWLLEQKATRGYCDAKLAAEFASLAPEIQIETDFDLDRYDDYAFGITLARGAIAETGSLVIDDASTSHRLGALAPWIHIAVLRPSDLWRNVPEAIGKLGNDPNVIWITGPSKTADVEGILIEGVHGPGHQIALRLAGSSA
jgi:L-lactate dehydrogenase complex protein LldG